MAVDGVVGDVLQPQPDFPAGVVRQRHRFRQPAAALAGIAGAKGGVQRVGGVGVGRCQNVPGSAAVGRRLQIGVIPMLFDVEPYLEIQLRLGGPAQIQPPSQRRADGIAGVAPPAAVRPHLHRQQRHGGAALEDQPRRGAARNQGDVFGGVLRDGRFQFRSGPQPPVHRGGDVQVGVAVFAAVFVQQIGNRPVAEHRLETCAAAHQIQVGVHPGGPVRRLLQQRAQVIAPAVVFGEVVHKQGGRAVVGRPARRRHRPVHQRYGAGTQERADAVRGHSGDGDRQFRQPFVDPGVLVGVGVGMDGVL